MTDASHAVIAARTGGGPTLTSRQQFTVLDTLLTNALDPLRRESDAFLEWVAEILANTVKSRRRNATEMMCACASILSGSQNSIKRLIDAGLDRGHAFRFLSAVREIHREMLASEIALAEGRGDALQHHATIHAARQELGSSARLSPALTEAWYWTDLAVEWRDRIVDNYLKLLRKGAVGVSRRSGGRIEVEPTFHDSWITAAAVVNRYRSDQATFTSALGSSLRGTHRVAASNALGLAAPGARVQSADALQTTLLDDASESELELSQRLMSLAPPGTADDSGDAVLLRAVMAASHDPDVRAALMVSELSPVEAMQAVGLGPHGVGG